MTHSASLSSAERLSDDEVYATQRYTHLITSYAALCREDVAAVDLLVHLAALEDCARNLRSFIETGEVL